MMPPEATVTINGKVLPYGEAMTLRVAVTSFMSEMATDGLGDDELGKALAEGYKRSCRSILVKIGVLSSA